MGGRFACKLGSYFDRKNMNRLLLCTACLLPVLAVGIIAQSLQPKPVAFDKPMVAEKRPALAKGLPDCATELGEMVPGRVVRDAKEVELVKQAAAKAGEIGRFCYREGQVEWQVKVKSGD